MAIKESELILTDEKKIYHLGLHPEEIGDYVITVGDPQRVEKVSKYFDKIDVKNQKREFVTHTGLLGNKKISVIGTGIGPDNIDIMLNEIDALKNIDFATREIKKDVRSLKIIRMGTSGSLRKDIPVDSIVASSHGLGFDGLLNFYAYEKNQFQLDLLENLKCHIPSLFDICIPYIFEGSNSLRTNLAQGFTSGITLTGGGFYGPQGRKLRIYEKMNDIIDKMSTFEYNSIIISNFEMETSN